jgi:hypothetical protein
MRFSRQFKYVATEAGDFAADVLCSDGSRLFEIEVKTDKWDLKNDFKKRKHEFYKDPEKWYGSGRSRHKSIPNHFVFCVPKELAELAEKLVEQHNPNYGIFVFSLWRDDYHLRMINDHIRVLRRPKRLHDNEVRPASILQLAARMSSELCSLRLIKHDYWEKLANVSRQLEEAALNKYRLEDKNG